MTKKPINEFLVARSPLMAIRVVEFANCVIYRKTMYIYIYRAISSFEIMCCRLAMRYGRVWRGLGYRVDWVRARAPKVRHINGVYIYIYIYIWDLCGWWNWWRARKFIKLIIVTVRYKVVASDVQSCAARTLRLIRARCLRVGCGVVCLYIVISWLYGESFAEIRLGLARRPTKWYISLSGSAMMSEQMRRIYCGPSDDQ